MGKKHSQQYYENDMELNHLENEEENEEGSSDKILVGLNNTDAEQV